MISTLRELPVWGSPHVGDHYETFLGNRASPRRGEATIEYGLERARVADNHAHRPNEKPCACAYRNGWSRIQDVGRCRSLILAWSLSEANQDVLMSLRILIFIGPASYRSCELEPDDAWHDRTSP